MTKNYFLSYFFNVSLISCILFKVPKTTTTTTTTVTTLPSSTAATMRLHFSSGTCYRASVTFSSIIF